MLKYLTALVSFIRSFFLPGNGKIPFPRVKEIYTTSDRVYLVWVHQIEERPANGAVIHLKTLPVEDLYRRYPNEDLIVIAMCVRFFSDGAIPLTITKHAWDGYITHGRFLKLEG